MATSHPDLSLEVSSMTVDQLKDVLDDVVNHQKPECEKSSLVRRLTKEASKDEMSLKPHGHFLDSATAIGSIINSNRKFNKGSSSRTSAAQSSGRGSQSLQDLATSNHGPNFPKSNSSSSFNSSGSPSTSASGSSSRKLNKATRANSFSLASNTASCPSSASDNTSQTRSSSASGAWANKNSKAPSCITTTAASTTNTMSLNHNHNISNARTLSSSAASASHNDDAPLTLNFSATSHVDVNDKNNNNDCDREGEPPPARHHSLSSSSSPKTYSHHSPPEDTSKIQSPMAFKDDQTENAIEMQDLRRQAHYVNYTTELANNNSNPVDSVVQFGDLTVREPIDDFQVARRMNFDDGPDSSLDIQNRQNRPYPFVDDPAAVSRSINPPNPPVNNGRVIKKKVKPDEPLVLAEHIEGYIGDKDVEYLVHYVAGSDSSKTSSNAKVPASAPGNSRKKPVNGKSEPRKRAVTDGGLTNGCLEEESREGSPTDDTVSSSNVNHERKFNKYPFTKSESLDSPAVSPSQAPSIASCVEYGRGEYSEDEMGYHSDREAGFVPYTRRKKVRGQSQKILHSSNKARSVGNSSLASAASSPLSNTPSVISASSMSAQGTAATTCRGYESEREYYAEDRKQLSRRKAVSSMPHSEQNSPENSDVDSSISLPVAAHRIQPVQKVSYAEMAASSSISTVKLPSDMVQAEADQVPLEDITSTTNTCINIKNHPHVESSHNQIFNNNNNSSTNCDLRPAASNPSPSSLPLSSTSLSSAHQTKSKQDRQTHPSPRPSPSSIPSLTVSHPVSNQLTRITTKTIISNDEANTASSDDPILEINFNKSNDEVAGLPPVIMFGESKGVVEGISETSSASFTFGFFDDIQAPVLSTDNSTSKTTAPAKVDNKLSSSSRVEVKRKMVYKASGPDIDTNSFNYNEILLYIQNAWDSSTRSIKSLSMKGSGAVTTES